MFDLDRNPEITWPYFNFLLLFVTGREDSGDLQRLDPEDQTMDSMGFDSGESVTIPSLGFFGPQILAASLPILFPI